MRPSSVEDPDYQANDKHFISTRQPLEYAEQRSTLEHQKASSKENTDAPQLTLGLRPDKPKLQKS